MKVYQLQQLEELAQRCKAACDAINLVYGRINALEAAGLHESPAFYEAVEDWKLAERYENALLTQLAALKAAA